MIFGQYNNLNWFLKFSMSKQKERKVDNSLKFNTVKNPQKVENEEYFEEG